MRTRYTILDYRETKMASVPSSPGFVTSVPAGDAMANSQEVAEGYTRHPRPQPKRRLRISITMEGRFLIISCVARLQGLMV
jgi:hypothetical protein